MTESNASAVETLALSASALSDLALISAVSPDKICKSECFPSFLSFRASSRNAFDKSACSLSRSAVFSACL